MRPHDMKYIGFKHQMENKQNSDKSNYSNINNPKARAKVLELMKIYNLADTFRKLYSEFKRFSWRQNNPFKHARLSIFLPLFSKIFNEKIGYIVFTRFNLVYYFKITFVYT